MRGSLYITQHQVNNQVAFRCVFVCLPLKKYIVYGSLAVYVWGGFLVDWAVCSL